MIPLNLPDFDIKLAGTPNRPTILDILRRKYVALTPEEWVRQHVVHFLIEEKGYPKSLINVEKKLSVNGLAKRYDVVVYSKKGVVLLVVECKAPNVTITQQTFDQIARYNLSLNAQYLMVTNGITHYYCQTDYNQYKYIFLADLPHYNDLTL